MRPSLGMHARMRMHVHRPHTERLPPPNSSGSDSLCCAGIELYGGLRGGCAMGKHSPYRRVSSWLRPRQEEVAQLVRAHSAK